MLLEQMQKGMAMLQAALSLSVLALEGAAVSSATREYYGEEPWWRYYALGVAGLALFQVGYRWFEGWGRHIHRAGCMWHGAGGVAVLALWLLAAAQGAEWAAVCGNEYLLKFGVQQGFVSRCRLDRAALALAYVSATAWAVMLSLDVINAASSEHL